jgi:hypothetical protein
MSVEQMEAAKRTGFHYSKRIALKPGLYNIRVGLRELDTERIGTAATWLEVPNLNDGKLTLSSILLTKDTAEGPHGSAGSSQSSAGQGANLYKPGSPLLYYLMIYNARSGDADLSMQWEIAEAGNVIHRTDWQPVASRVIGRDKKGIEVGGQLKLTLQPGIYELRIEVKDAKSKKTAQRVVSFAIES